MALKQEIEVLLFWNNNPVSISKMSQILCSNPASIKKGLMDLVREYELRDGGLQISHKDHGFIIEPKEEYSEVAQKVAPVNLKVSTMRTLATIAIREPVMQREVVEVRGSGAYDHIRELVEARWVTKKAFGQTYSLKTTSEFRKHFQLSESGDELKTKLKEILKQIEEAEAAMQEENIQESLIPDDLENMELNV